VGRVSASRPTRRLFVSPTEWDTRSPADGLLEAGTDGGEVREVRDGGHAVAADTVDLVLSLLLPFGVESHSHQEELAGTADGDDTDEVEEADHAAGEDLLILGLVQSLVTLALDLLEVAVGPCVIGELAAPHAVLGQTEVVKPPSTLLRLALDLKLIPRVDECGELPQRGHGVDERARHAHAVESGIGAVTIGLALRGVVPGETRHDATAVLTGVIEEAGGVEEHKAEEALHL